METEILAPDRENVERCARLIAAGEIVAFPTETVYGLGASALNESAVKKIYAAKGRPGDNPLIVHVATMRQITDIALTVPKAALTLAAKFMPGPLTLVLKKKSIIPNIVTGGLDTVAVRMPRHPVALSLIRAAGLPICAPSANLSTRPSPTTARHVYNDLAGKIPCILDGGSCEIGIESTVIDVSGDTVRLLRAGGLPLEKIRETVGEVEIVRDNKVALCPGMKYKHYAPKAEVLFSAYYDDMASTICQWYDKLTERGARPVVMCLSSNAAKYGSRNLLKVGDSYEDYAHNLFTSLRLADDKGYSAVIAEGVPDSGIGSSLINRLVKSSGGQII